MHSLIWLIILFKLIELHACPWQQMCRLKESGESLPIERLPVPLQDNQTFQQGEQLFSCTDVTMRQDGEQLWLETGSKLGLPVVVLFISVHGLSLLCKVLKE